MGACYYVKLKVKVTDEESAIKVLNEHIAKDTRTDYSLSAYAKQGITTETFDDLMRIFLAGWKNQEVTIEKREIFTYYSNSFDACYGWESIMMEMFETLTPFLKDGSELLIYPDSDYDRLIVEDGKCIQVH